jgi:hypothetical protein
VSELCVPFDALQPPLPLQIINYYLIASKRLTCLDVYLHACTNFKLPNIATRHIWKCGGTTMARQIKAAAARNNASSSSSPHQTALRSIAQSHYMTFVRDPVEHFLSGWAECGYRAVTKNRHRRNQHRCHELRTSNMKWEDREDCLVLEWMARLNNRTFSSQEQQLQQQQRQENPVQHHMDRMVLDWLKVTRTTSVVGTRRQKGSCSRHSFPQANFLLQDRNVMEQLVLVADLRELKEVLTTILKLSYNDKLETGRNSSTVYEKQKFFPSRRLDWLSNETIRAVCEFVAIDYFLFDFDPPEPCRDFSANYTTHG